MFFLINTKNIRAVDSCAIFKHAPDKKNNHLNTDDNAVLIFNAVYD
jgi:hypothetical protein